MHVVQMILLLFTEAHYEIPRVKVMALFVLHGEKRYSSFNCSKGNDINL